MKNLIITLVAIFLFSSCNEKYGNLDIVFNLKYGDQDLTMLADYNYPTGERMIFSRFSMYLSNLRLIDEDKILKDVDFINMSDAHQEGQEGFFRYTLEEDLELGSYQGIEFSVGVDQVSNNLIPADFVNGHPLASTAEYWSGWESYVFCKIEGQIDLDNDNVLDESFALHLGSDAAKKLIRIAQDFTIEENNIAEIMIDIDLRKLFDNNGVIYDIETNPQLHSLSQTDAMLSIADQLPNAFGND